MEASQKWFEQNGYALDAMLYHQDIIPFIKKYIYKRNFFTITYLLFNLIFLAIIILQFTLSIISYTISFADCFLWFSYGCAITFLLIPLHEGIHGLAYKICGAPHVTFEANWKKLYFMAIADKFAIGRKPFYFVGLSPFVFISSLFIFLSLINSAGLQIMFTTVVFVHASMCAGDFGLMSYFAEKKNLDVVTFDDHENSQTFFFVK